MLNGNSAFFSPELLAAIYRMGHGDEIVLADAHFPGHSINNCVIRADGLQIEALLAANLPLLVLNEYADDPAVMMECVPGDVPDPSIETGYRAVIDQCAPQTPQINFIERFDFY
jgi:L-fucose mutarotase